MRGVRHVGQALAELAAELTCLSLLIGAGPSFPRTYCLQLRPNQVPLTQRLSGIFLK